MKMHPTFFAIVTLFFAAVGFPAAAQPASPVTSAPVYVPDLSHQNDPLPDGIIAWDDLQKSVDATNGQDFARFVFNFTNIAAKIDVGLATNVTCVTNFTTVTNTGFWARMWGDKYKSIPSLVFNTNIVTATNSITPLPITILDVHPSCGCTTDRKSVV